MRNSIDFKSILNNTNRVCKVRITGATKDIEILFYMEKSDKGFSLEYDNKQIFFMKYSDNNFSVKKLSKYIQGLFDLSVGIYIVEVNTDKTKYNFTTQVMNFNYIQNKDIVKRKIIELKGEKCRLV